MFVKAIEEVTKFTRPICTITRNYNETSISPGAATLFFVNELGYAITCKHVADLISNRDAINAHYSNFRKEKEAIGKNKYNQRIKELETKYGFKDDMVIQLQQLFINVTSDPSLSFRSVNHPKYDLAILIFENFKNPLYQSYARFVKDSSILKQGEFLCRLGFPFPEFTQFKYNQANDDIEWTDVHLVNVPAFPIEGMLTRNLSDGNRIFGLELSTPGLRGQSGGPLFNKAGLICGMQSATNHLHLGFDMKNHEYKSGGKTIRATNQPFLHVGNCIHPDVIKEFLKENNVKYYEE